MRRLSPRNNPVEKRCEDTADACGKQGQSSPSAVKTDRQLYQQHPCENKRKANRDAQIGAVVLRLHKGRLNRADSAVKRPALSEADDGNEYRNTLNRKDAEAGTAFQAPLGTRSAAQSRKAHLHDFRRLVLKMAAVQLCAALLVFRKDMACPRRTSRNAWRFLSRPGENSLVKSVRAPHIARRVLVCRLLLNAL